MLKLDFKSLPKPSVIFTLLYCLIFFFFWRVASEQESVEKNVYDYYAESVVYDGDLNIFNQIPAKEQWQTTITGNYPDVHSNGIVSLWVPFFLVKKILFDKDDKYIFLFRSISTIFYGVLGCVFILTWLNKIFDIKNYSRDIFLFFIGTSFFWYLLFQSGNADISSFFIACLELIFFHEIYKHYTAKSFFVFSVLLGYGISLKVDHVFYLILVAILFFQQMKIKNSIKEVIYFLILFMLGVSICLAPMIANDFYKYGYYGYGYKDVLNFNYYQLWQNLFYPTGYLNNNPVYLIPLIMIFFEFFKTEDRLLSLVGVIPIVSILVESFAYIHHESYGARHWLAYIPVFLVYYLKCVKKIRNKGKPYEMFLYLILTFMIVKNWYACYEMYVGGDDFYFGKTLSSKVATDIKTRGAIGLIKSFFIPTDLVLKNSAILTSFAVLSALLIYFISKIAKDISSIKKIIAKLSVLFAASYVIISGINIYNQKKTPSELFNSPPYISSLVGNGPHVNSFYENIGTIEKSIKFYQDREDTERVYFLKKVRRNYVQLSINEITRDPLGISKKWMTYDDSEFLIEDLLRQD